jgi:diacylglycerol kinase family enzyme
MRGLARLGLAARATIYLLIGWLAFRSIADQRWTSRSAQVDVAWTYWSWTVNGVSFVMAGLGFDAAMIRSTSADLKAKVGWPAYIIGAVRALVRNPNAMFEVTMDEGQSWRIAGAGVLIGNVGTSRPLTPP